ncbi:protein trichome birefringence-like 13 isoform X2 [Salvia miltiorrhiza]|uniref:protein trichome birefringence-like 13 isoform X2 n=1 Tax=Salvia miltiorrhiza TaxID=226208 RepID=UPI0025AC6C3C|nr:protein trichome birefringence-like 13 isoform X2 [Salvia miltiorrhiza]
MRRRPRYSTRCCLRRAVVTATTRTAAGSMIHQSDLPRGMTTRARRYLKDGIALEVTNRTPSRFSGGGGNPTAAIYRRLIPHNSSSNFETPALALWIFNSAGFVGDSLNRNMFVSLFCALRKVSAEVKKWRPAGADRGFTFLKYNLTIAYHRTNLLARYGRWSGGTSGILESLGYKDGYRIDVDIPDGTWAAAPRFHDILIFNTGHWWWAPSKFDPVKSPMLFFEKGVPVTPLLAPDAGLAMVLRHMVSFVEKNARKKAILFFRTQSPRHFEGGDWDQGGSCPRVQPLSPREVEQLFSIENNGTNVETRLVNGHLYRALRGSKFQILDITRMSEFRADAHPSAAGGKRHDDCMHWCLPGLTDTWNDLFIAHLSSIKGRH